MEAEERDPKRRKLSNDRISIPNEASETTIIPGLDEDSQNGAPEPSNNLKTNGTLISEQSRNQLLDGNAGYDESIELHIDHLDELSDAPEESTNGEFTALNQSESTATVDNLNSSTKPLSKSAQKRLRKHLDWESKREERKLIRKQKQIAKRERRKEMRREEQEQQRQQQKLDDENGSDIDTQYTTSATKNSKSKQQEPPQKKHYQLPITILIDCDFDDLMRDPERISLAAQITRCYSDNRQAPFRAHLGICSFGGHLKQRFDNVLSHYKGWRGVKFVDDDFVAAAEKAKNWMRDPKYGGNLTATSSALVVHSSSTETEEATSPGSNSQQQDITDLESQQQQHQQQRERLEADSEIIYLTSDAEETLTKLKPYSTYIIGGLVDKNREKGLCYKRARQRGVRTARLPIGEFLDMASRKILATNHVCEIMLKWLESGDWGEAFMKVIPKRKGGKLKVSEGEQDEAEENHDDLANHEERGDVRNEEGNADEPQEEATLGVNGKASVETDADIKGTGESVEHEDEK